VWSFVVVFLSRRVLWCCGVVLVVSCVVLFLLCVCVCDLFLYLHPWPPTYPLHLFLSLGNYNWSINKWSLSLGAAPDLFTFFRLPTPPVPVDSHATFDRCEVRGGGGRVVVCDVVLVASCVVCVVLVVSCVCCFCCVFVCVTWFSAYIAGHLPTQYTCFFR